jgi:hypothetical protein
MDQLHRRSSADTRYLLTNSALLLDTSDVEQITIKSPRDKAPGIPFEVLRLAPYTYAQYIITIYEQSIREVASLRHPPSKRHSHPQREPGIVRARL